MIMRSRRSLGILFVLVALVGGLAGALPAAASRAPYCGIYWGSLPKGTGSGVDPGPPLTNIRAGRNTCFDRLVFDVQGPQRTYHAQYVPVVVDDPRGEPVPLRGGAFLSIVVSATAYDLNGNPTYPLVGSSELVNVTSFRTFRQVAWAGSFEGITTIGLGVRARLPFRVFILAGPGSGSRLVVDVAHQW
jgi:hypothetical protein